MKGVKYSLLVTFIRDGEDRHQINQVVVDTFVSHDNPKRNTATSAYKSFVMKNDKLTMKKGSVNGQFLGAHFEIFIDMLGKPHVTVDKEVGQGRYVYYRLLEEEIELK